MAESWANYKFKTNLKEEITKKKTITEIANTIGIERTYLSQIFNGRKCTKIIAYACCKAIAPQLEINDLFYQIG